MPTPPLSDQSIRALEGESLTLDMDARTRAADALSKAASRRIHSCGVWDEGDGCTICWDLAAAVIRAAEGLRKCPRCNGGGMVAPGDCCPECGGNGLALLESGPLGKERQP